MIQIARYSGLPVAPEHVEAYKVEFQAAYDKLQESCGADMLKMHEELEKLDKELAIKWQRILTTLPPRSEKAWKKMVDHYGCPIMIARSQDNPEQLVFVLMDMPIG